MFQLKKNLDITNLPQPEIKNLAIFLLNNVAKSKEGLGKELFEAIAKLTVQVAIEAICLRTNPKTNAMEIYLTLRSANETAYPGLWHHPGSIMRSGEEVKDVFSRLSEKEVGVGITSPKFIGYFNNPKETRGHFLSLAFLCTLEEKAGKGKWFFVDELPENIIEFQRKIIIPAAVRAFASS